MIEFRNNITIYATQFGDLTIYQLVTENYKLQLVVLRSYSKANSRPFGFATGLEQCHIHKTNYYILENGAIMLIAKH